MNPRRPGQKQTIRRQRGVLVVLACLALSGDQRVLGLKQETGLKIVVLEGEDSVNIIDKKTAVKPVVEVRDRNDVPVAGASVRFAINGQGAAFNNGLRQLTVTTNSVGRATVSQLSPLGRGAIEIQVQASYQGQTAAATIHQMNFANVAEAAQAGRVAGQAGAAGATGGGLSSAAIGAIVGGAAAAVGVGVAVAQKGDGGNGGPGRTNSPPTLRGIAASTDVALQNATLVSFFPESGDADGDTLTYMWDLGDGTTSTETNVSHIYTASGSFTVRVTVSDGKASAAGQTTITVRNVTGRWVGRVLCPANAMQCQAAGGQFPITIDATQTGTNVSGTSQQQVPGFPPDTCTFTGGRVADPRLVAFSPFQGCAVLTIFQGCVGALDASLNRFSADNLGPLGSCELTRQ